MKMRVQAQHLQAGDIVGSGEKVISLTINSVNWPNRSVQVILEKPMLTTDAVKRQFEKGDMVRVSYWGKYTMINIERPEKEIKLTTAEEIDASDARYLDEEEND